MKKNISNLLIILTIAIILLNGCAVFNTVEIPSTTPPPIKNTTAFATSSPQVTAPSPLSIPTSTPTPALESFRFTILATGDVMAHGDNLKSALDSETGKYSFKENYIHVKSIIEKADLAICNLETVIAGKQAGYTSYPLFNTPAAILDGLKYAGFSVLVTANNHALDRGETGVVKTLEEIHKRGLFSTGSYIKKGTNYLVTDIKNIKVSVLAFTQHLNGNLSLLTEDKHYMINQMDMSSMISDIHSAAQTTDLVIVYLHWGNEYIRSKEDGQSEIAHKLIDAGADVIFGTHPHVIRPDEIYIKDGEPKYIIYSMGNYISNFIRQDKRKNALYTEDGVMIKLTFIVKPGKKPRLESATPIPTWPYKYTDESGIHYEIIPIEDINLIKHNNPYVVEEAKLSYLRTMESLTGFNTQY